MATVRLRDGGVPGVGGTGADGGAESIVSVIAVQVNGARTAVRGNTSGT
jgi:hypothetical protein